MKYARDSGDPYLNKESGVLRNLLGIKDQAGLDKAESSLSFLRFHLILYFYLFSVENLRLARQLMSGSAVFLLYKTSKANTEAA